MYSTFEQYKTDGGALPEDQYNVLAKQAAYMIDAATMGPGAGCAQQHGRTAF